MNSKASVEHLLKLGSAFLEKCKVSEDQIKNLALEFSTDLWIKLSQNAVKLHSQNLYYESLQLFKLVLDICIELKEKEKEKKTLKNIGEVSLSNNAVDLAISYFIRACKIENELGDKFSEGNLLHKIGLIYYSILEYQKSLDYFRLALTIFTENGNRKEEGMVRSNIGSILRIERKYKEALDYLLNALKIRKEVKDKIGEAITRNIIGLVYKSLGKYEKSIEQYQSALEIVTEYGLTKEMLNTLNSLSTLYLETGQNYQAIKNFYFVLYLSQKLNDKDLESLTLNNLGSAFYFISQYQKAVGYVKRALNISRVNKKQEDELTSLNNLGEILKNQGNFDESLEYLTQSLDIKQARDDKSGEIIALNNIGDIHRIKGNYTIALEHFTRSLNLSKEINDPISKAIAINNIGTVLLEKGQFDEALEKFKLALKINQSKDNQRGIGKTQQNIGYVYATWGFFEKALEHYSKAQIIFDKINDIQGKCDVQNKIGLVYYSQGKYQAALDLFQKVLEIYKTIGDKAGRGVVLQNIGLVYGAWSQYQRALDYFTNALEISRDSHYASNKITLYYHIGMFNDLLENYQLALDNYQIALDFCQNIEDNARKSDILNGIGVVHKRIGKIDKSMENYSEALKIAQNIGDQITECATMNNIGELYSSRNQYKKAVKYYKISAAICRNIGFKALEGSISFNLAVVYALQNKLRSAYRNLKKAIDIFEVITGEAKSDEIRKIFRGSHLQFYHLAIDLFNHKFQKFKKFGIHKTKFLFNALKFLEMSKAREISDKFESGKDKVDLAIICPELKQVITKENQLTNMINEINVIKRKEGTKQIDKAALSKSQIEDIRKELVLIRQKIFENCHDPGLVRVTSNYNPYPLFKEIFSQNKKSVVWEFYYDERFKDYFQIIVWSNKNIDIIKSNEINLDEAIKLIHRVHKRLKNRDALRSNVYLVKLSKLIGNWLPVELWETINDKDLLIIIPHNKLHLLPWSLALRPSQKELSNTEISDKTDQYLGLQIPLVYSYNLSLVVSSMKREKIMKNNFLFVVNPNFNIKSLNLMGTEKEFNSINQLLDKVLHPKEQRSILRYQEATKKSFKDELGIGPSIIHFTGHGNFDTIDPWLSSLRFYSEIGDSHYTVTEMLLDRFIGSPLIVISACETAKEEFNLGDEAIGLKRGLTLAGATSLVATNWLLDDTIAPYFMKSFYEQLLKGKSVAKSLFLARRKIYYDYMFKEPLFWGVYELYGNPFKRL